MNRESMLEALDKISSDNEGIEVALRYLHSRKKDVVVWIKPTQEIVKTLPRELIDVTGS